MDVLVVLGRHRHGRRHRHHLVLEFLDSRPRLGLHPHRDDASPAPRPQPLNGKTFRRAGVLVCLIKIVAILTLIAVAIVLIVMGFTSASGYKASVSNLWSYGGFAPRGWSGFFGGFQIAVFAYVGIELVGTTSAETANPPKTMPKAINAVPVRVLVFYVAALLA